MQCFLLLVSLLAAALALVVSAQTDAGRGTEGDVPESGFLAATLALSELPETETETGAGAGAATKNQEVVIRVLSSTPARQQLCSVLRVQHIPTEAPRDANRLHAPLFIALRAEAPGCQAEFVETDWAGEEGRSSSGSHSSSSSSGSPVLANGRPVYSNGRDLLSYVAGGAEAESGGAGTWIINRGVPAGTDSGFAHMKPAAGQLSPVGQEWGQWHWLEGDQWVAQPLMRLTCEDRAAGADDDGAMGGCCLHAQLYRVELFLGSLGGSGGQRQLRAAELRVACGQAALLLSGQWVPLRGLRRLPGLSPGDVDEEGWQVQAVATEAWQAQWRLLLRRPLLAGTAERAVLAVPPPLYEHAGAAEMAAGGGVVAVGAYTWAWLAGPHDGATLTVERVLLRRVSRSAYRAWPADRVRTMRVSALQADTGLLLVPNSDDGDDGSAPAALLASAGGERFRVQAWHPLLQGPRLLEYVESLLGLGAGAAPSQPEMVDSDSEPHPCFLYHPDSAVPEPLVYVAELVCLLRGHKQVVMVQYDTPSEAQHRHPLVRPLVRAILALASLPAEGEGEGSGAITIAHSVARYRADTTLLLYRQQHRGVASALRPAEQVQALHPIPYPDYSAPAAQVREEEEAQIYNAAWNGYTLGYPRHMVTAYCRDFHNGLSPAHKQRLAAAALAEAAAHFALMGVEDPTVTLAAATAAGRGVQALPEEQLAEIYALAYSNLAA